MSNTRPPAYIYYTNATPQQNETHPRYLMRSPSFTPTTSASLWSRLRGSGSLLTLAAILSAPLSVLAQPAQAPVNLRSTANFGVLAASLISSIPPAAITGDVGLSPATGSNITGMNSSDVTGIIYTVDVSGPAGATMDPTRLTAAQGDLTIAYNDAAGRTPVPSGPFLNPGSGNIGGLTLVPGLYKFTSTLAITGSNVTLTGSDTSVWIFQVATDLNVGSGIQVILAGGAQARNIFWQVGTSAVLGTTSVMQGTIMADQSVSMNTGAVLNGRALARIAAVTLASNTITLPANAAGSPRTVTGVAGNAQVSVSWLKPLTDTAGITAYKATAVNDTSKHCTTTGNLGCVVTGLTNGTPYTFTVTATGPGGVSAPSSPSASVTPRTIASAPTTVAGTAGNGQAVITWAAPSNNGGSAITGYTVTAAPGGATCATTGALTCTVTGLTNGSSYTFTVSATNVAGNSSASAPSAAVIPITVPGAPTTVAGTAGNGQVVLTWTAPTTTGGSTITGYTVTAAPGGSSCVTTGALTCTVTGLTNGTAYTFTATATNSAGPGTASAPSAAVTPRTVPGAPTAVVGVGGSNQVSVSWTAPLSNGGSAITSYTVTTVQDTSKHCTTTNTLTCNVTGLAAGTGYTFTVKANNAAGSSVASAASPMATTGILFAGMQDEMTMQASSSGMDFHFPAGTNGIRVSVKNMQGRDVWSRTIASGTRDLRWNGVTASGLRAVPGIYLVRVTLTHPDQRFSGSVDKRIVLAP
jgi:hypothetical protein